MTPTCLEAAEALEASVEVIDLRTLVPLDIDMVLDSVRKTGRCVIVHEAPRTCGYGAELAALVAERALMSLQAPIARVAGRSITTVEGLGSPDAPHRVQAAFVAEQAAQCGYCTSGMIMTASAFLARNPKPSEAQIRAALDGNLCRCGTHMRILRAVRRAAS